MKVLVVMNSSKVKFGGGIIQVILNYRDQLLGSPIEYSFAMNIESDEELIRKLTCFGEKYYYLPDKKVNLFRYVLSLFRICKCEKFDAIHVHGNSATMIIELIVAKICGVKNRISHCHNSKCSHGTLNKLLQPLLKKTYTKALACSDIAGDWIYGKNKYIVLHNAIDLEKFRFSQEARKNIREQLCLSDDILVIGHVGNFNEQKNQEYLIEIFKKILEKNKAVLILLGSGSLESHVKELVKEYSIEDMVFFEGVRKDVYNWMSAMDIFVFPSKWEGLGMVAIEAQACGLPVLASDQVPSSARIADMQFLPLETSAEIWSEKIVQMHNEAHDRKVHLADFRDYDVTIERKKLLDIYLT